MDHLDEYRERARNDPRTTDELLEDALAAAIYKDSDDDVLSDTYWKPVRILHARADGSVMSAMKKLLSGESSADRALAADVLAQVAVGSETRRTEAADLLLPIFERETDREVLISMAYAFGHIGDERSIPRLVELSDHPDESLRHAVVYGLSGQDDARAIAALVVLSSDPDEDVRNWATFGLGSQTEADTPELRNALVGRLNDPDDETRQEALVGLARRGDTRVVRALLKELEFCSFEMLEEYCLIMKAANAAIHAAKEKPDAKWCLLLQKLKALDIGDSTEIQSAIEACRRARL